MLNIDHLNNVRYLKPCFEPCLRSAPSLPATFPIGFVDFHMHPLHPPSDQLSVLPLQSLLLSFHSIQLHVQGNSFVLHIFDQLLLLTQLFIAVFQFTLKGGELSMCGGELLSQSRVRRSQRRCRSLESLELGLKGRPGGLCRGQVLSKAIDLIAAMLIR